MSIRVPGGRDTWSCLEWACINTEVKVDWAIGQGKEKGVHIDVDGVNEGVVGIATGCHEA
jgi:hypothetical protein